MPRLARVLALGALAAASLPPLTSCGSSPTSAQAASITVGLSASAAAVTQGQSQDLTVTITRTAFDGAVSLSATGMPTGVTASFSPASLSGSTLTSTLTLAAAANATAGDATVTVHATGSGVTEVTATVTLTVNASGAFGLSMTPTSLDIVRGASDSATINVARTGGFTGTVVLTVSGAPSGVTATASPDSVTGSSSVLHVVTTASADTGNVTLTIKGNSAGTTQQTTTLGLHVSPGPGFGISVSSTADSVGVGGFVVDTVTINRTGGFQGMVVLTATGLPTGVTATFNPDSTTGNTSVMTLAASASAATGPATVVVHGNSTGMPEATANVSLSVTAPSTTAFALDSACVGDPIIWLGYKTPTGGWTHVTPTSGVYHMDVTPTFQLVIVQQKSGGTSTFFGFMSLNDVSGLNGKSCTTDKGTISASGSVAGLALGGFANINAASQGAFATSASPNFTLDSLPSHAVDLFAAASDTSFHPVSMILRRNQTYTNGATIATLDFSTNEAFSPVSVAYAPTGAGNDSIFSLDELVTSLGTDVSTSEGVGTTLYGVPDSQLVTGDYQLATFMAQPSSNANTSRMIVAYQHALAATSMAFGPTLSTPTITTADTANYARMRVQLAFQAQYDQGLNASFMQGTNDVQMTATAGYFANNVGSWDVTMPDVSAATGWNNAWGLQAGQSTNWSVSAMGGEIVSQFGQQPAVGTVQYMATMQSSSGITPSPVLSPALWSTGGQRIVRRIPTFSPFAWRR